MQESWFERVRSIDIRVLAAIAASLMLIIGVMWIVPTTPNSNKFTFDAARRSFSSANVIELGEVVPGAIVDGSDADFYRISPVSSSVRIDVRMTNGSPTMIPAVRIYDATTNLVLDRTKEYVQSPGANVDCSFLAQSAMTYYIQVSSQRNTKGPYRLTVTIRPV